MARLNYSIWSVRKNKTEKEIVEQGVTNKEQLDAFLAERGVSLPADLTEFEILWKAQEKPGSSTSPKKPLLKKAAKPAKDAKVTPRTSSKPARSTRSKTNIKDADKQ